MTFQRGEIIECHSAQAGHKKYYLCVLELSKDGAAAFLFINSKQGWAGDLILPDSDIPCLPKSPTGQSIISCSQLVRINEHQLKIYGAKKLGELSPSVARKLEKFIAKIPTLSSNERKIVLDALAIIK